MSRTSRFFIEEASACVATARTGLTGEADQDAIYRAVRRFRGSAQMAQFDDLARTALDLELRLRSGEEPWDTLERDVRSALSSLEAGLEAIQNGATIEDEQSEAGMVEETSREQPEQSGQPEQEGPVEVVSLDALEYRGEAALERALELRTPLEDAIVSGDPTGPMLDELFDLIRLGAR